MKKALSILIVCLLLTPAISVANESKEPKAPESSHRKTALKLIEVANTQKLLEQMMAQIESLMDNQFKMMGLPPEGQKAADEFKTEIMVWFAELFQWENMKNLYVDIYTEVFTEEELIALIDFYESPIGQKMLAKMPELMQKTMQKTQAVMADKMPAFQRKIEQKVAELQEKYKK